MSHLRFSTFSMTALFLIMGLTASPLVPNTPGLHSRSNRTGVKKELEISRLNDWFKRVSKLDLNDLLSSTTNNLPSHFGFMYLRSKYRWNKRSLVKVKGKLKTYRYSVQRNVTTTVRNHDDRGVVHIVKTYRNYAHGFWINLKKYVKLRFGKYIHKETKNLLMFAQPSPKKDPPRALAITNIKNTVGIQVLEISPEVFRLGKK